MATADGLCLILAGGQGSRMGGGKPARILGGHSLLERALGQAANWSDRAAIAVRDRRQVEARDIELIVDDPEIEGPLAGLAAALRLAHATGTRTILTLPADMPFLPSDLGERLDTEIGAHLAAIASSGGHLHPVCGLWRTRALEHLSGYLASGRRSLRAFAEAIGYVAVEWPSEPFDPFFNVNTPGDLTAAERLLGS